VKTISATSARAIPTPRFDEGYARLPGAGYAALHPELEGINPEDYPDLTKLRILADVAPYSREYNRIRAVVEKQSRGDAALRADYEQIVDQGIDRVLRLPATLITRAHARRPPPVAHLD